MGKETPEDLALIDNAKQRVKDVEAEIEEAKKKWNIFGARDRALADLNRKLDLAKQRVPEAEQEAKRRARERLQKASLKESLEEYSRRVYHVLELMGQSRQDGLAQLEIVTRQKESAFASRDAATKIMQEAKVEVDNLQQQVKDAEAELELMVPGSNDYVQQETKISGIRKELEVARVGLNNAVIKSNSKTEYARELELDEVAIQRLVGNLEAWIIQLKSASEERTVTFQARLQAEQLLDDQEVAANVDHVGAATDKENRERMAQIAAAADRQRQDMMADLPHRQEHLHEVMSEFAKNVARAREVDAEFLRRFEDQYDLDPLKRSEFAELETAGA
ncbi:MAG: hypothetical protein MRY49_02665 [Candidatus Pacebacteria bacterium]|nr:hypothetical protein [Candidatus Paceibacterota bacterium]